MQHPDRSAREVDDLRQRVGEIQGWYHAIDFGDGVLTPGPFAMDAFVPEYGIPDDLEGKRVLDVGCGNGFFCAEFAARGAAEVVGLDVPGWLARDWNPAFRRHYLARTSEDERRYLDEVSLRGAFDLVAAELGRGRIRREEATVYDLDAARLGTFDLVFCASVLMHVRDPLLALVRMRPLCHRSGESSRHAKIRSVGARQARTSRPSASGRAELCEARPSRLRREAALCRDDGLLVISVSAPPTADDSPTALFVGGPHLGNYWQLSPACVRRLLSCADFDHVDDGHLFVLRDRPTGRPVETGPDGREVDPRSTPGSGRFADPHYVCHARPSERGCGGT